MEKSKLKLESPNGKFSIHIEATNTGAAIWLTEKGVEGVVSIYNGFNQGQVVGLGDPTKSGGYPLAMGVKDNIPNLQFAEDGEAVKMVKLGELPEKSEAHVHCCHHTGDCK
jgi:hypothetical protein